MPPTPLDMLAAGMPKFTLNLGAIAHKEQAGEHVRTIHCVIGLCCQPRQSE